MLIPRENRESLLDLIFTLAYKVNQNYKDIMEMPYWRAREFKRRWEDWMKNLGDMIGDGINKLKAKSGGMSRIRK